MIQIICRKNAENKICHCIFHSMISQKVCFTKIRCSPKLKGLIESFHKHIWGTVQHDGNVSKSFEILSGLTQGCVLAPTPYGILFSLFLRQAFSSGEEGVYMHTRAFGKLFNPSRLKAKTKIKNILL